MHSIHNSFMQRCLTLARKGLGYTYPNPMVGAVVVRDGKIIGEGWHKKAGTPHAEVHALKGLSDEILASATLYVNLEPCAHFGKTPPCCDLIISKGIKKVVVGAKDPNPKVAGKGIDTMQKAGIEVLVGVFEKESMELNKRFYCFHTKNRPYIILKWAQSADGFIAPENDKKGEVRWISDPFSQQLAHQWRAEEHAILVGRNTVTQDNPLLTTRKWKGNNPIRLVIDPKVKIDPEAAIFNDAAPTVVFNTEKSESLKNVDWKKVDAKNMLNDIKATTKQNNIQSILVEGGEKTVSHFLEKNLWDECRIITSPERIKMGISAPKIPNGKCFEKQLVRDYLQIIRA
jgi:diaminohydroxyphosphoribosylaminopyrimidine deaminase/5-amino-6-(5-phosphoribosylamino)uracil reductase